MFALGLSLALAGCPTPTDLPSSILLSNDSYTFDPGGVGGNGVNGEDDGPGGDGPPLAQGGAPGIMVQDANDNVLNGDTLTFSATDTDGKTVKATVTGAPEGYDYLIWSIDGDAAILSDQVAKGEPERPDTHPVIIPLRGGEATVTVINCNSNGWQYSDYDGGEGGDFTATFTVQVEAPKGSSQVNIQLWTDKPDDPFTTIPGRTLSRTGSNSVPKKAVIEGKEGYSVYQWTLNGVPVEGDTAQGRPEQYTFDSALKGDGQYTIGLRVKEDSGANAPWYSTTIIITVLN
jgi:hypothetical protein